MHACLRVSSVGNSCVYMNLSDGTVRILFENPEGKYPNTKRQLLTILTRTLSTAGKIWISSRLFPQVIVVQDPNHCVPKYIG